MEIHMVICFLGEKFGSKKGPTNILDKFGLVTLVSFPTKWAPSSYKWSYNPI